MFKLWSETNHDFRKEMKPDLWIRSWNELSTEEKYRIWKYLEEYFFNKDQVVSNSRGWREYFFHSEDDYSYAEELKRRIQMTVLVLNENAKHKTYGQKYLASATLMNACDDFYEIFKEQDQNVVLEMLSIYSRTVIKYSEERTRYRTPGRQEGETDKEYEGRCADFPYFYFDRFSERVNEVFNDFWVGVILTRQWFIPKQEKRIVEEIFVPVLKALSNEKWAPVNRDLSDAFSDYHNKDYSGCVTKTISAIQWFLQVSVTGSIGEGKISKLIPQAIEMHLVPDDVFTKTIFKNVESIVSQERQETWDAHPKAEYASEQNARLVMNIAMVFIQHFIQISK